MIKVLKKASDVLELIGREGGMSLKNLCAATGLKKPGLFLILKSLTELGLVRKAGANGYEIGDRLLQIAHPAMVRNSLLAIAGAHARSLAEEIREEVVVSVLHKGERFIIARASVQQSVMVNTDVQKRRMLYETATGRVLLASLDESALRSIAEVHGLPGDRWPRVVTFRGLRRALSEIAEDGIAFKTSGDGQANSLAVPVFGSDGKVLAAIGVAIPASRFTGERREKVVQGLRSVAARMSHELLLAGGALP